jgi:hypothetical protein
VGPVPEVAPAFRWWCDSDPVAPDPVAAPPVPWWRDSVPVAPDPGLPPPVFVGAPAVLAFVGSADVLDECDVLPEAAVEPPLGVLPGTPFGSYIP